MFRFYPTFSKTFALYVAELSIIALKIRDTTVMMMALFGFEYWRICVLDTVVIHMKELWIDYHLSCSKALLD